MESGNKTPLGQMPASAMTYQEWLIGCCVNGLIANGNWGSEPDDRIADRATRIARAVIQTQQEREGK